MPRQRFECPGYVFDLTLMVIPPLTVMCHTGFTLLSVLALVVAISLCPVVVGDLRDASKEDSSFESDCERRTSTPSWSSVKENKHHHTSTPSRHTLLLVCFLSTTSCLDTMKTSFEPLLLLVVSLACEVQGQP